MLNVDEQLLLMMQAFSGWVLQLYSALNTAAIKMCQVSVATTITQNTIKDLSKGMRLYCDDSMKNASIATTTQTHNWFWCN